MDKQIRAVILAAGASRRMGRPKQLLPYGDRTVLQSVVDTLTASPLEGVLVVLGHRAGAIRRTLSGRPVDTCVNPEPDRGMLSSVRVGLESLPPGTNAMLLALADQPRISIGVVSRIRQAYQSSGKGIVVPTHAGKRGHPTLIDLDTYGDAIRALDGSAGLKPLVRGHPEDTLELELPDQGILADLDTPEDYRKALENLDRPDQADPSR
jgi:molybdenum cofactor cytidylyltransferase